MEEISKILKFIGGSGYGSGDGYGYGSGSGSGDGYGSGYGYGDGYGSGYGHGSGYGYGDGYGSGYGHGSGSGSGSGDGYGYGSGSGSGDGYGSGYGYGSGDGDGYGSGYGYGSGDGDEIKIKVIKNDLIFYIDGVPTIIDKIHNNIAKGKIVNEDDFSLQDCYIGKYGNCFAHENSARSALDGARNKFLSQLNIDDKIKEFTSIFDNKSKYPGKVFFEWHNILTGSCLMGRTNFIQNGGYSMDKMYSVKEFISACENAFGGDIIKRLKEYYK